MNYCEKYIMPGTKGSRAYLIALLNSGCLLTRKGSNCYILLYTGRMIVSTGEKNIEDNGREVVF
jgi:hypothetical protein